MTESARARAREAVGRAKESARERERERERERAVLLEEARDSKADAASVRAIYRPGALGR
jgi:hypothetical protein